MIQAPMKKDLMVNGCRMDVENTLKICAAGLWRIWNKQPEQKLLWAKMPVAPKCPKAPQPQLLNYLSPCFCYYMVVLYRASRNTNSANNITVFVFKRNAAGEGNKPIVGMLNII